MKATGMKRYVSGERLVFTSKLADQAYWEEHWEQALAGSSYRGARKGALGWFEDVFCRHLPPNARILEGGCGLGNLVLALRIRGYDCEGVDSASGMVFSVKAILPDLPIRNENVLQLKVPDGYYGAYISLGVVEHRREGPEPFLREAYRILSDDGVLLLSVPHYNTLRRAKARLGIYKTEWDGSDFYQYAFKAGEMREILAHHKFHVIEIFGYDAFGGLFHEVPALGFLFRERARSYLKHFLNRSNYAGRVLGHMILFVCKKAKPHDPTPK